MTTARRRRSVAAATALMLGSVAASLIVRRRNRRVQTRIDLYFEDGSMVSLPESTPQVSGLLSLGEEALQVVGSPDSRRSGD